MTSRGDLIIWNTGPAKLYEGNDPHGWGLLAELTQPPRRLGTLKGPVYPTDDGHHAWIWDGGGALEYVDTVTGQVLENAEIPDGYGLAFAAGDQLVITDGNRIELIDTDGDRTALARGQPIEATPELLIWETCDSDCALMISPLANPADAIRVPSSGGADHWTVTGAVAIPSSSPDLPTITRDSRFLLIDALSGSEADITHRITTVDLETGSAKILARYNGPVFANAFWDERGEHIVVLTNTGNGQDVTIISVDTMDQHALVGALPEQYWVLGAG